MSICHFTLVSGGITVNTSKVYQIIKNLSKKSCIKIKKHCKKIKNTVNTAAKRLAILLNPSDVIRALTVLSNIV